MRSRTHIRTACFIPTNETGTSGSGLGLETNAAAAEPAPAMISAMSRLRRWLAARENEHLEFKEARNNFHFEKLVKYCAALANEGGGSIVLGVGDKRPRRIVGSQAFTDVERTKAGLLERLRFRVEIQEITAAEGRVLIITAPPRPLGVPIGIDGAYWMRAGEDLVPMTPDALRSIFDETRPDFSAEVCQGATLDALDPEAVRHFRKRWHATTSNDQLLQLSAEQLLRDAELVTGSEVTYAALILLDTNAALGKYLAQAETVFEYRSSEAPGPANQRQEFREGFLLFHDRVWNLVNLRNDKQHHLEGFFMRPLPTFNEGSVREALLNAVAHRDYRQGGSIFVRQYARRIEIVSPGGFPSGISSQNILDKQFPRNRRIADALLRCGLVERAGQGVNRMVIESLTDSKPPPDYSRSDEYEVFLELGGEVQDTAFVKFLVHLPTKQKRALSSHHYLVLDLVRRNEPIPRVYRKELKLLRSFGLITSTGRGRGARHFLSAALYNPSNEPGGTSQVPTRNASKRHVLALIENSDGEGCSMADLLRAAPHLSRDQIRWLLRELQTQGRIRTVGRTKAGRWILAAN